MPSSYLFPPWIQAPESITKSFATGLGIAADVQNQRAAIQEKEASDALWASISREANMQRSQYQQEQLALDAQRLAQDQQMNQLKVQEAQQRFDAYHGYQNAIAGGMDPGAAALRFGPGMDLSLQGIGTLARQLSLDKAMAQPLPDIRTETLPGGQQVSFYPTGRNAYGQVDWAQVTKGTMDPLARTTYTRDLTMAENAIKALEKEQAAADASGLEETALSIEESKRTGMQKRLADKANKRKQDMAEAEWKRDWIKWHYGEGPDPGPEPRIAPPAAAPGAAAGTNKPVTITKDYGTIPAPPMYGPPEEPWSSALRRKAQGPLGAIGRFFKPQTSPTYYEPPQFAPREVSIPPVAEEIRDKIAAPFEAIGRMFGIQDLKTMSDKQLNNIYRALSGIEQDAIPDFTREEVIDAILKLKKQ